MNNHPLYNALNSGNAAIDPAASMKAEYDRFRQNFRGDPQQEIMRMIQSGQVTQQQLNEAQRMMSAVANLFFKR